MLFSISHCSEPADTVRFWGARRSWLSIYIIPEVANELEVATWGVNWAVHCSLWWMTLSQLLKGNIAIIKWGYPGKSNCLATFSTWNRGVPILFYLYAHTGKALRGRKLKSWLASFCVSIVVAFCNFVRRGKILLATSGETFSIGPAFIIGTTDLPSWFYAI